jgi:nucleoside-diphosphate-sugar epimerase
MKVLITGGAGFIGYHLARKLSELGVEIDLLDDFSRGVSDDELAALVRKPGVHIRTGDLRRHGLVEELPKDYAHIYHLAAIVGVRHVLNRPYAVLSENVAMLMNVLEVARAQKDLRRLIFASTSEVYAGSVVHLSVPIPTTEGVVIALPDIGQPRTSYMLSKLYGEALCRHSGLPVTIVRPHNVYGPRMGLVHVIPELMKKAHAQPNGGELEVLSVDHWRTFCFVEDAVEMVVRAAAAEGADGSVLNVGKQAPETSIGELAELILKTMKKDLRIVARPAAPGSPLRRSPDMSQTTAITGYVARVELPEGLQSVYEWYRRRVFEGNGTSAL